MSDNDLSDGTPFDNIDLPDSRLKYHRTTICGPIGLMSRVFCANCGCDGGLVTEEWAGHIMYICDDCANTCGRQLPGMVEIPEESVRGTT